MPCNVYQIAKNLDRIITLGPLYINGDKAQIAGELKQATEIRSKLGPILSIDEYDALAMDRDTKLSIKLAP